jgi:hypothetical protein
LIHFSKFVSIMSSSELLPTNGINWSCSCSCFLNIWSSTKFSFVWFDWCHFEFIACA